VRITPVQARNRVAFRLTGEGVLSLETPLETIPHRFVRRGIRHELGSDIRTIDKYYCIFINEGYINIVDPETDRISEWITERTSKFINVRDPETGLNLLVILKQLEQPTFDENIPSHIIKNNKKHKESTQINPNMKIFRMF
jgi:hypothetical protein